MAKPRNLLKLVDFFESNVKLEKLFKYNLMSYDIEFTRDVEGFLHSKHIEDENIIDLKYYISSIMGEEFNKNLIEEALIVVSRRYAYNPLMKYLKNLQWDGKPRLDTWLIDYLGAEDNEYVRKVGKKILCGAISRAYEPGSKFDYMLILEGSQGIKKSTLLETLCGEWYIDTDLSSADNRKDLVDTLRSGWIVEIGDMSGFNKADIRNVKAFITRKVDMVRLPYGRRVKAFPKKCILIGTHNPTGDNEYLRDDSGNRRFWPIECSKADCIGIKANRDQIFAEAIVKYKEGEKLFLDEQKDKKALDILCSLHSSRESSNPIKEIISNYVKIRDSVTSADIITNGLKMNISSSNAIAIKGKQTLIGIWMRKNGWVKHGDTYYKSEKVYLEYVEKEQKEIQWEE